MLTYTFSRREKVLMVFLSIFLILVVWYQFVFTATQAQLADAIGYSDKSVSKWERGEGTPDIFLLLTLSEIYGVTVSELVGQTEKCKDTQEKMKAAEHDCKALERAKKKALERAKKQKKHSGKT